MYLDIFKPTCFGHAGICLYIGLPFFMSFHDITNSLVDSFIMFNAAVFQAKGIVLRIAMED